MQTIKEERLTDFIVVDDLAQPNLIAALLKNKDELGLSNVILPHSRMGGSCVGPAELTFNEFNYHALRRMEGTASWATLLQQFLAQIQQQGGAAPLQSGMQLPFNMSIADLPRLMQLDASPKALEPLQRVLDSVFDAYAKQEEHS